MDPFTWCLATEPTRRLWLACQLRTAILYLRAAPTPSDIDGGLELLGR